MQLIPAYEVADIANAAETNVSNGYSVGYADSYVYSVDGELLKVNSRSFQYVYFYAYFNGIEDVLLRFIGRLVPIYVKAISVSSGSSSSGSYSNSGTWTYSSLYDAPFTPLYRLSLFKCNLCEWEPGGHHYFQVETRVESASWSSFSTQQFVLEGVEKPVKEVVSFGIFYANTYHPILRFIRRYNIVLQKTSTSNSMFSQSSNANVYTVIYGDCPGHPGSTFYNYSLYRSSYSSTFSSENLRDVIESDKYVLTGMLVWRQQWSYMEAFPWSYSPAGRCVNGVTVWGGTASDSPGGYFSGSKSEHFPRYFFIGCLTDKVR